MNRPFAPETTLCCLKNGQSAVVEGMDDQCPDHCRLREMGLCVGGLVTMLMTGSLCAVAVNETRLMVRREALSRVRVAPLD